MQFKFSANNNLGEFEDFDPAGNIYIGFASEPQVNVFSQKFRGSQFGSTTAALLGQESLLSVRGRQNIMVHLVQESVTLDGATAAYLVNLTAEKRHSEVWKYFSTYISDIEKGVTRPPFMRSLYAFFYASSKVAREEVPAKEDFESRNRLLLKIYHESLDQAIKHQLIVDYGSLCRYMDLLPNDVPIRAQEDILAYEQHRYLEQDYKRSEQFELELPLKTEDNRFMPVNMLACQDSRSSLFKFFARNPQYYPNKSEEKAFPMTYVHNSHREGQVSEHIISIPPGTDYNLKGLSNLLEQMEDHACKQAGDPPRSRENPRPGYDYDDPWYDERHSNYSILDTPKAGSRLRRDDVLEALWYYGCPLNNIHVENATLSFFIPGWIKGASSPGERVSHFTERLNESTCWKPFIYPEESTQEFLPYLEKIFLTTGQKPTREGTLQAWEFQSHISFKTAPAHVFDEGPGIKLIRELTKLKTDQTLEQSDISLRVFCYEYGLVLININVDLPEKACSITDTQWMEHHIGITPAENLLGNFIDLNELELEMPRKHSVSSTLSNFTYLGSYLEDKRSVGGALQMMTNDVEPIFKNLPYATRLFSDQVVLDEQAKRYYYCSGTSILNYDEFALKQEHDVARDVVSMIFNMVLSQKSILSRSRKNIVVSEYDYNERRRNATFWKWLMRRLGDETSPEARISEIREEIQHMTTSSWFNVISQNSTLQRVFDKLREQMMVVIFYDEVQERCSDLDEFIAKKRAAVQNRVFDIFTFVMSPLSMVIGFMGGTYFTQEGPSYPFPFLGNRELGGWTAFGIYIIIFSILFAGVWILYKWKSMKE
jgi:hypothetical protein